MSLFCGKQYEHKRRTAFLFTPCALIGARGATGAMAPTLFDILLTAKGYIPARYEVCGRNFRPQNLHMLLLFVGFLLLLLQTLIIKDHVYRQHKDR